MAGSAKDERWKRRRYRSFPRQLKEGGEESLTSISLAISILAVLVAMVTVLGHRSHTEAVLMQSKAGDQWNLYEAKKIREDSLLVVIDQMALAAHRRCEGHRRQTCRVQSTHRQVE